MLRFWKFLYAFFLCCQLVTIIHGKPAKTQLEGRRAITKSRNASAHITQAEYSEQQNLAEQLFNNQQINILKMHIDDRQQLHKNTLDYTNDDASSEENYAITINGSASDDLYGGGVMHHFKRSLSPLGFLNYLLGQSTNNNKDNKSQLSAESTSSNETIVQTEMDRFMINRGGDLGFIGKIIRFVFYLRSILQMARSVIVDSLPFSMYSI